MKKVLLFILIFYSYQSSANEETVDCIDGKIRYVENKKEVIINDHYCFDSILKTITSTKKCPKHCTVDDLTPLKIKRSELTTERDSPLFKICRKANGVPQAIEYWANNKWIPTSRCLYNDGSYQNIDRLISSRVKYED